MVEAAARSVVDADGGAQLHRHGGDPVDRRLKPHDMRRARRRRPSPPGRPGSSRERGTRADRAYAALRLPQLFEKS
jgi:hypothetical protein